MEGEIVVRIAFMLLVFIHGIIHLLGFLKAFRFAELNQLKLSISKSAGLIWLVTAILFMVLIVSLMMNTQWWWIPGIIAIVSSQLLIISSWHDAKVGTVANIIILIVCLFGVGFWQFTHQTNKNIDQLLAHAQTVDTEVVSEQMLEPLPSPVQKWLNHIGLVGKEEINTVYFKQQGSMKLKPDQTDWYSAKAEQYVTVTQPGFVWNVRVNMMPVVPVTGRDMFKDGNGQMVMKIGSLIPVVDVFHNPKVDESTLHRYLLELPLYPSAALQSYIDWEAVDQTTAKATMSYQGVSGSALFSFNQDGELLKISAMRYKDSDEDAKRLECIGEIKESTVVDGIKIPTKLDISWMLDEGKFTWYKLEIYDMKYNINS